MTLPAMKAIPSDFLKYCNPLHRELHLGRQFVVERAAMSALRSLGLLNQRFSKHLPPEIWALVIEILLDPLYAPYKYCTAESFPFYRLEMRPMGKIRNKEGEWQRVRLVCRTWTALAGPRRVSSNLGKDHTIPQGITVFHCDNRHPYKKVISRLVSSPVLVTRLTTLSIADSGTTMLGEPNPLSAILTAGYNAFPSLRSLSLFFAFSSDPDAGTRFWSQLEQGFPQLISLSIGPPIPSSSSETIIFPALEILDMSSTPSSQYRSPKLHLPSLKHLSLSRYVGANQVLIDHANQLESLLILGPMVDVIHEASFWEQVPNLLTLGGPLNDIERAPALPADHPLRQICILSQYHDKRYLVRCRGILDAFPGILLFTFSRQRLSAWNIRSLRGHAIRNRVELRELPLTYSPRTPLWIKVAEAVFIVLVFYPIGMLRYLRQKLGFRW